MRPKLGNGFPFSLRASLCKAFKIHGDEMGDGGGGCERAKDLLLMIPPSPIRKSFFLFPVPVFSPPEKGWACKTISFHTKMSPNFIYYSKWDPPKWSRGENKPFPWRPFLNAFSSFLGFLLLVVDVPYEIENRDVSVLRGNIAILR